MLKKERYLSMLLTTEIFSDFDREDSDKEISSEEILIKNILMKKIKYRMCRTIIV